MTTATISVVLIQDTIAYWAVMNWMRCSSLDSLNKSFIVAMPCFDLHCGHCHALVCLGLLQIQQKPLSNRRFGDTTGFIFPHTHRAPKSLLVKCWKVNGSPFRSEGIIEAAGNYFYLPVSAVHLRAFLETLGTQDWEPLQVLAD